MKPWKQAADMAEGFRFLRLDLPGTLPRPSVSKTVANNTHK